MNMDKFGIVITFIILGSVMVVASLSSGMIDLGSNGASIPQINAGTSTDGFYDYCYRMGLDC
jgi:hypothetical protein